MVKQKKVIYTKEEKCVGCNKCNVGCPAIFANVAYKKNGMNKIRIDQTKCIRCGRCIGQCDHSARDYYDDTERFFRDLEKGQKISVIVAPSLRNNFENQKKLFGYLKKKGVNLIYDVSFGADIVIWAVLKAAQRDPQKSLISSTCPVIVNYIEKYQSELVENIAPIHSPAACTVIYLRKYENLKGKIAFLSPCIAKTDEFKDLNPSETVKYNVTYKKLKKYLAENGINPDDYEETEFDNQDCSLGLILPKPGGLKEYLLYYNTDFFVSEVSGDEYSYKYLDQYDQRKRKNKFLPQVVDILNCEGACTVGTGTNKDIHPDDVNLRLHNFKKQKINKKELKDRHSLFDKKLKFSDFKRKYNDKSYMVKTDEPIESEYDAIFKKLHKNTEESRRINCYACGYGNCRDLAKSILKGTNHINNCIYYNQQELEIEHQLLADKNAKIKKMLQELKRINIERKENETRMMSIPIKMADGVFITDTNGIIEISNPAIKRIFGYSAQKVVGKPIQSILPDLDFEKFRGDEYINTIQGVEAKTYKNELINLEIAFSKLIMQGKKKHILIVRDISERKQVEKLKDEFVSVVSHELRTPVTTINATLKLLTVDKISKNKDKSNMLIENALESSSRLINLLNDILDTQKMEAGKMEFSSEAFDIMSAVNKVVRFNIPLANEFKVKCKIKKKTDSTMVYADKNRLIQVITNLLSNAVKFSPKDTVVTISVYKINDMVRVSVADKGAGIPAEYRKCVFEKFGQVDTSSSRKSGGTGLGLSISKAIIEEMGGKIGFRTRMGKGTTFYFDLPEYNENREEKREKHGDSGIEKDTLCGR